MNVVGITALCLVLIDDLYENDYHHMLTSPVPSVDIDKHIGYPALHSRSSTTVGNQANDSGSESNSNSDVNQEHHEPTPPPPSAVT